MSFLTKYQPLFDDLFTRITIDLKNDKPDIELEKEILIINNKLLSLKQLYNRSLYHLIHIEEYNLVKLLVSSGKIDINKMFPIERTYPIIIAARKGNIDCVKFLLDNGANINDIADGLTALSYATKYGHLDMVKFLIEKGANIKANTNLLYYACGTSNLELVKYIYEKDPNSINLRSSDEYGYTPLMNCAMTNNLQIAEFLLNNKADINETASLDMRALILATRYGRIEMVKLLLNYGANVHARDSVGKSALMCASHNGNLEIVKLLVEINKGSNINDIASNDYKRTPLMYALSSNKLEVVKYLVENNANINDTNEGGETIFFMAVKSCSLEIIEYLLSLKVIININKGNDTGMTPLIVELAENSKEVSTNKVKLLLEHGANIHAKTQRGNTALTVTAKYQNIDAVKLLLQHHDKPDINAQNNEGYSALLYAVDAVGQDLKNIELVQYLLTHNPNLQVKDNMGVTPLMKATKIKNIPLIKLLLEKAGNDAITLIQQTNDYHNNALTYAKNLAKDRPEILQLFNNYLIQPPLTEYITYITQQLQQNPKLLFKNLSTSPAFTSALPNINQIPIKKQLDLYETIKDTFNQ